MSNLPRIAIIVALLCTGVLLGASLYDAVVLAPNLQGGPAGLEHGRLFMAAATPANLFRVLSPLSQIVLLLAVVANWSGPRRRWPLVGALVLLIASDVLTFTYHYPRLRLMFTAPLTVEPGALLVAAREWATANLVRVALVFGSWLATLIALLRLAVTR